MENPVNSKCIGLDLRLYNDSEALTLIKCIIAFKNWSCDITNGELYGRQKTGKIVLVIYIFDGVNISLFDFQDYGKLCIETKECHLFSDYESFLKYIVNELKYH